MKKLKILKILKKKINFVDEQQEQQLEEDQEHVGHEVNKVSIEGDKENDASYVENNSKIINQNFEKIISTDENEKFELVANNNNDNNINNSELGLNENVSENNNISKTSEEANFEISQNKQKKNEQKQQKRKQKKKEEEDEEDEEIDATTNADEMEEDVDITNENLGSTVISSNNVSDAMPIEKNKTQFDDFSTTDEQQTQSDLSSVGNVESTKQIDETAKQNKSELNQIENNNNKRKFVDSEVIESKKKNWW